MALFESYERRIDKINQVLNSYGIASLEEAEKITKDAGLDVYNQVKGIQPICFENACWAYITGAAIAIKKGCRKASDAAAAIGEGLQAFCIPGSVADQRKVGLGHGNLGTVSYTHLDVYKRQAYLRAKEDYLMGINFSRLLTLKYGNTISGYLNTKYTVISVGRVMTCVLGMVVRREREIREFVKTPFYRVLGDFGLHGRKFEGEWRAVSGSVFCEPHKLYKENGFKKEEDAKELIRFLEEEKPVQAALFSIERKKEKKNPPLLFNLAELQNECSRRFKLSPDETLRVVQELYEKKLVTYPRTDARVLSTAVAKEIDVYKRQS